jgi:hypothetical protein
MNRSSDQYSVNSYRDSENLAYKSKNGVWFRITSSESFNVLQQFLKSDVATEVINSKMILPFSFLDIEEERRILKEASKSLGRDLSNFIRVIKVETLEVITYPYEWTDEMLRLAADLTLKLRLLLLEHGFDLKDSSANNIKFLGLKPIFMDLGSIQIWNPNPTWNAYRQFINHFYNPLILSQVLGLPVSNFWNSEGLDGISTATTRKLLGLHKIRPRIILRHAAFLGKIKPGNIEDKFRVLSEKNRTIALRANLKLTKSLLRNIAALNFKSRASIWSNYHLREHYSSDELERKQSFVHNFISKNSSNVTVLDLGGNDGAFIEKLSGNDKVRRLSILDLDDISLNRLLIKAQSNEKDKVNIFIAKSNLMESHSRRGLFGQEFMPINERMNSDLVLCHAVLHHLVITRAIPLTYAIDVIRSYGKRFQFEFVDEMDDKVRILISNIPNWRGEYNLELFMKLLGQKFDVVEYVGLTSSTRHIIECF